MTKRPYRHTGALATFPSRNEAIARERVLSAMNDFAKLREVSDGLTAPSYQCGRGLREAQRRISRRIVGLLGF
jgi:hypothetical protein